MANAATEMNKWCNFASVPLKNYVRTTPGKLPIGYLRLTEFSPQMAPSSFMISEI